MFICLAIGGNNFKYLVKVASARFPYYQRVVFLLCNSETNFTRCYFETMSLSCSSFNSYLQILTSIEDFLMTLFFPYLLVFLHIVL